MIILTRVYISLCSELFSKHSRSERKRVKEKIREFRLIRDRSEGCGNYSHSLKDRLHYPPGSGEVHSENLIARSNTLRILISQISVGRFA